METSNPRRKQKQETVRILFQGLYNSGKSSVMLQLRDGKFVPEPEGTHIGEGYVTTTIEGTEVLASVYARREDYKHLFHLHFIHFDGTVFVVDSVDTEKFDEILEEIEVYLKRKEVRAKVMLVLANKQDLDGAVPVEIIEEKVMKKVSEHECSMRGKTVFVAGCSAKTREGLDKAMSQLLEKIEEKKVEELEKKLGHRFLKKLADVPFLKSVLFC